MLFRDEFLRWTYAQLRMTGKYGVKELREFEAMEPAQAAKAALAFFRALRRIERVDIAKRYAALGCNRQEAAE